MDIHEEDAYYHEGDWPSHRGLPLLQGGALSLNSPYGQISRPRRCYSPGTYPEL